MGTVNGIVSSNSLVNMPKGLYPSPSSANFLSSYLRLMDDLVVKIQPLAIQDGKVEHSNIGDVRKPINPLVKVSKNPFANLTLSKNEEAIEFFSEYPKIMNRLDALRGVAADFEPPEEWQQTDEYVADMNAMERFSVAAPLAREGIASAAKGAPKGLDDVFHAARILMAPVNNVSSTSDEDKILEAFVRVVSTEMATSLLSYLGMEAQWPLAFDHDVLFFFRTLRENRTSIYGLYYASDLAASANLELGENLYSVGRMNRHLSRYFLNRAIWHSWLGGNPHFNADVFFASSVLSENNGDSISAALDMLRGGFWLAWLGQWGNLYDILTKLRLTSHFDSRNIDVMLESAWQFLGIDR